MRRTHTQRDAERHNTFSARQVAAKVIRVKLYKVRKMNDAMKRREKDADVTLTLLFSAQHR